MPVAGRPDLHVVARFLDCMCRPGEGAFTRSRLQRAVRLNYDLFRRYLELVVERGLVAADDQDPETFRVTEDGRRVHRELVAWLHDLFGGEP